MIAFFCMLIVACVAAEWYSLRHALDGITHDCRISKGLAEPGETLEFQTILTNRRMRFVPFLRVSENVPSVVNVQGETEIGMVSTGRNRLNATVYLMPRQRLIHRTSFHIDKRGRYLFLGAELSGGDFLGFRTNSQVHEKMRELVILPKRLDADVLNALPGGLMGDRSVNRFIHEDPMMIIGYRDYTGREPMKQIAWTQTARMGRMMVRVPDHTIEQSATVVVNLDTFTFGSYGSDMIEKLFSLARGVCEQLEEMRVPYTYLTNARIAGEGSSEANEGLGRAHLAAILEGMGRATGDRTESIWSLVDRAAAGAEIGRTFILITPVEQDLAEAEPERITARTGIEPRVLIVSRLLPETEEEAS